jgi:hypothetical protein
MLAPPGLLDFVNRQDDHLGCPIGLWKMSRCHVGRFQEAQGAEFFLLSPVLTGPFVAQPVKINLTPLCNEYHQRLSTIAK